MEDKNNNKLGLWSLIAMVIGSMIGGGAFSLPADMSKGAGAGAIIIGWCITGVGMIALAFVYQNLSMRKPDLNGGIYSYAKAGFGDYMGFTSAWGYWLSAWIGNVSYVVMLFGAIGYFIPAFGKGNNLLSIVCASILLWSIHSLILKGIKQAAFINVITTIGKLVPIFVFITVMIIFFNVKTISIDFWGGVSLGSVMNQVKSTMLVTLWVFIGIEGAVVISGRAKKRSDVGKATVIGLIGTLIIYILISVLSLGVMSREGLSQLDTPSMAYAMEHVVGKWGAIFINLGLIVSLFGALLGWTMLAGEIPYVAAKDGAMPKLFAKENVHGSPVNSLWITNGLVEISLIVTLFSSSTYQALYTMATSAILVPYLFSALYGLKLTITGETYDTNPAGRGKDLFLGIVSSIYATWLIYAAGMQYMLMVTILYSVGIFVFVRAKKERNEKVFLSYEKVIAVINVILAVITFS